MNVTMTDQLPRLIVSRCKTQPHDHVVEAPFQLRKQMFTGDSLLPRRLFEIGTELVFEYAVDPLHLLLLSQLQAVSHNLRLAIAAVLSRRKVTLFDCTRRLE